MRRKFAVRTVLTFTILLMQIAFPWSGQAQSYKRVFVTSSKGDGNLSGWPEADGQAGAAAGDAICRARAQAANYANPEAFVAWLSDSSDDAYCRVHGLGGRKSDNCGEPELPVAAGPWIRADYYPFAETIDRALDGEVYAPAWFDEAGIPVGRRNYFTGSNLLGEWWGEDRSCRSWTSGAEEDIAEIGNAANTAMVAVNWSDIGTGGCNSIRHLLCVETGVGAALPPHARQGRPAFVTSVYGTGNLSQWTDAGGHTGLDAGDAICRARASEAGLDQPESFKAWLSDEAVNALDRLAQDGPWVRTDGVPLAESKADLADGDLFTTPSVTEDGSRVTDLPQFVWTGTEGTGIAGVDNCDGWTVGGTSSTGQRGWIIYSSENWSRFTGRDCANEYRLYCFGDAAEPGRAQAPVASVLPTSRSVVVDSAATVFATMINPGNTRAIDCNIRPANPLPLDFNFQTTDPATNLPTGGLNQPADIEPGGAQSFIIDLTPRKVFEAMMVDLVFDCGNSGPETVRTGVNTLLLSASSEPVPDVIALSLASSGGTLIIEGPGQAAAFAVAAANVGATGTLTVSADTGAAALPLVASLCHTDPLTAACLGPAAQSVTLEIAAGTTPTFSVFATATGTIAGDPSANRIFVRFRDPTDAIRGSTSVAVQTL